MSTLLPRRGHVNLLEITDVDLPHFQLTRDRILTHIWLLSITYTKIKIEIMFTNNNNNFDSWNKRNVNNRTCLTQYFCQLPV